MSSTKYSVLTPEVAAEMLAAAANPEYLEMPGAPCGKNMQENLKMMLAIIRDLEAISPLREPDRTPWEIDSFIL